MRSLTWPTTVLSLVLSFWGGCAFAAEPVLPEAFRARILEGVDAGVWQSLAIGQVRGGMMTSEFFGHADGRDGAPLDEHSRVELGALSEAYVGLLLANLVIDGKVHLSDTLSDALPEFRFDDAAIGRLTLLQLATFRSGLPSIPPNLFPRSDRDPFVDYDTGALRSLIAHARPQDDTGGGLLDATLLAYALEQRTGGDAVALLRTRVIAELGLEHTGFGDGDLAVGYYLAESAAPWHFSALAPARGLRSDLDDQLKFAQAFLRPVDGPLQAALLLARHARGDAALGWHVLHVSAGDQDWPLLWNSGISSGHASFVGLRADRQQAVVLLGNSSTDLSALGLALLTDAPPPVLPLHLRRLELKNADQFAGLYRFDAKDEVIVRPDGDGLSFQRKGQFPLHLIAYDDDAFVFAGTDAQVTFQRSSAQRVESLLLHQGGLNVAASRLSSRAPQQVREAMAVDAVQRAACVGDFALGEIVLMHVAEQGTGLTWQLSGTAPRALVAYAPHRYASSDGSFEMRCNVDDRGVVTSLKLSLAGGDVVAPRAHWSVVSGAPVSDQPVDKAASK